MNGLEERVAVAGRTVWVVGAGGGGIGTAVCAELAGAGAQVVALDRDGDALDPTAEACQGTPGRLRPVVVDATDRDAMEAFAKTESDAGRVPHGLVNIVGGLQRHQFGAIAEFDDATFDAILQLNLRAAWLASQLFARSVIGAGARGSVVQLASIAALQGMPFGAPYGMAKAALISLARSQALEWGPQGIRVNVIAAGTIATPRATTQSPERDRLVIPLGRRGQTRDIAGAALFLLSDLAAFVTGQVIAVDGGASVKPSYLGDDGLPVFVEDEALRARLFPKRRD